MNEVLNKNLFFVKEYVGMFKAANEFDVCDPETKQVLMLCREPNLGFFTKIFRFTEYKRMTPFDIQITTPDGKQVLRIKRNFTLFLSSVEVFDENDKVVGRFKQKFFSFGGAFKVLDVNDVALCELKGKWTGWDFKFIKDNIEFAQVTKKWAGFGKEFFTSADNYVLSISDKIPPDNNLRILILAAVMCIDMVLKE